MADLIAMSIVCWRSELACSQVRTFERQTGVPQIQFRRRYKRQTPYIFFDREIQQIMEAAVRNQSPFQGVTKLVDGRPYSIGK